MTKFPLPLGKGGIAKDIEYNQEIKK